MRRSRRFCERTLPVPRPRADALDTVRVFGRPEELAERLEASGYDIPKRGPQHARFSRVEVEASEIEAGMELHLPCLVKVGPLDWARGRQGNNGYNTIEEPACRQAGSCPKLPNDRLPHPSS